MPTDKEFENIFREQLNGLEEAPPPMAWQNIREEIKPRRTNSGWFVTSTLVIIAGVLAFFGLRYDAEKPAKPAVETSEIAAEANKAVIQSTNLNNLQSIEKTETKVKESATDSKVVEEIITRKPVYQTYLATRKKASESNQQLETASQKMVAGAETNGSLNTSEIVYQAVQKQEALNIVDQNGMDLALKSAVKTQKPDLNEAITETFGPQTYTEAITDTVNSMVLEVPYSVQPQVKKSWFGRFTGSLHRIFSGRN